MTSRDPKPTREERLAAKLRENLKRRKQQARAMQHEPLPEEDTLSKATERR